MYSFPSVVVCMYVTQLEKCTMILFIHLFISFTTNHVTRYTYFVINDSKKLYLVSFPMPIFKIAIFLGVTLYGNKTFVRFKQEHFVDLITQYSAFNWLDHALITQYSAFNWLDHALITQYSAFNWLDHALITQYSAFRMAISKTGMEEQGIPKMGNL